MYTCIYIYRWMHPGWFCWHNRRLRGSFKVRLGQRETHGHGSLTALQIGRGASLPHISRTEREGLHGTELHVQKYVHQIWEKETSQEQAWYSWANVHNDHATPRQKIVCALSTCQIPVTPSQCSTRQLSGRPSARAQTTIIRGTSSATPPTRQDCRQASPPSDLCQNLSLSTLSHCRRTLPKNCFSPNTLLPHTRRPLVPSTLNSSRPSGHATKKSCSRDTHHQYHCLSLAGCVPVPKFPKASHLAAPLEADFGCPVSIVSISSCHTIRNLSVCPTSLLSASSSHVSMCCSFLFLRRRSTQGKRWNGANTELKKYSSILRDSSRRRKTNGWPTRRFHQHCTYITLLS